MTGFGGLPGGGTSTSATKEVSVPNPPPPPALFAYLDPLGFSVLGVGRETPGIEAPMAVFPEVSHMARVRFP